MQYKIASLSDGAIILNSMNGSFFRANPTAVRICQFLQAGVSKEEITSHLMEQSGLPFHIVNADVEAIRDGLNANRPISATNFLQFERVPDGYVMAVQGQPTLWLAKSGRTLRPLPQISTGQGVEAASLVWVAPHLIRLRYANRFQILHASAVRGSQGVVAFLAPSGTGKTTTAANFASHGCFPVAEDLLLLDLGGTSAKVVLGGEQFVRSWAERNAGASEINAPDLDEFEADHALPLDWLGFIQRGGRPEPTIQQEPIGATDTALALLTDSFAELNSREVYSDVFFACCRIAEEARAVRLDLPEGIDNLRQAVAHLAREIRGSNSARQ